MKKLFIISMLFLVSVIGFAQKQDSVTAVTLSIQPPQDAIYGEIYCYRVEYIEAANADKKDAWKCMYIVPSINKKSGYAATSCVLSGLKTKKIYIFRVYAFYCGDGYCGFGEYGQSVAFRTPENKGNAFVSVDCGLLNIEQADTEEGK